MRDGFTTGFPGKQCPFPWGTPKGNNMWRSFLQDHSVSSKKNIHSQASWAGIGVGVVI